MNNIKSIATKLSHKSIKGGRVSFNFLAKQYNVMILVEAFRGHAPALSSCRQGTNFIVIPKGLSKEQMRYKIAHELGHIILHKGNRLVIASEFEWIAEETRELEADIFAAYFLIPEIILADKLGKQTPVWRLADEFMVPDTIMGLRLTKRRQEIESRPIERLVSYV